MISLLFTPKPVLYRYCHFFTITNRLTELSEVLKGRPVKLISNFEENQRILKQSLKMTLKTALYRRSIDIQALEQCEEYQTMKILEMI